MSWLELIVEAKESELSPFDVRSFLDRTAAELETKNHDHMKCDCNNDNNEWVQDHGVCERCYFIG